MLQRCEHAVVGTVVSVQSYGEEDYAAWSRELVILVAVDFKGNATLIEGTLTVMEVVQTGEDATGEEGAVDVGDQVLVFTELAEDGRIWVYGGDRGRYTFWAASASLADVQEHDAAAVSQIPADTAGSELGTVPDLVAETRASAIQHGYAPLVFQALVPALEPRLFDQQNVIDEGHPQTEDEPCKETLRPSELTQARADLQSLGEISGPFDVQEAALALYDNAAPLNAYLWPQLPIFADAQFSPRPATDLEAVIIDACWRADEALSQHDDFLADTALYDVRAALAEALVFTIPIDTNYVTREVRMRHLAEDSAWREDALPNLRRHYLSTELALGAIAKPGDLITLVGAAPAGNSFSPSEQDVGMDQAEDADGDGGMRDRADIYTQNFDTVPPSGWTTYGEGPQYWAWREEGSNNWAWCNSDAAGSGTSITEWLYQTSGVNCTAYTNLHMIFQSLYDYYGGNESCKPCYCRQADYPTFTILATWDTSGEEHTSWTNKDFSISAANGDPGVHMGFIYHGTYDYYWKVDAAKITGTIAPQPDLVVADIWVTPDPPQPGQSATIHANLCNNGNAGTGIVSIPLRYYVDGGQVGTDDLSLGLGAGSCNEEDTPYTATSCGTHQVCVKIDPDNIIPESDNTNNQRCENITWNCADLTPYQRSQWNDKIPVGITQLSGDDNHTYNGPYYDNQSLYFNWASLNQGTATASQYTVRVEVTGTGGSTFTWTATTDPTYYTYLTNDRAVGPLSAGSHTFKLWVDYNNIVFESSETNNYYEHTITVQSALADLVVADIWVTPDPPQPGQSATIHTNLCNNGNAGTGIVSIPLRYYVDGGQVGTDDLSLGLGAGSCNEEDTPYTATSCGTHQVCVRIDPDNIIPESDNTNNQRCENITWNCPDIQVGPTSLTFDCAGGLRDWTGGQEVLVVAPDGPTLVRALTEIERAGGHVLLTLDERILWCYFPADTHLGDLESTGTAVIKDAAAAQALTGDADSLLASVAAQFARATGVGRHVGASIDPSHPLINDALRSGLRGDADDMTGTVKVAIVFVESDGTTDPDKYTWTTGAENDVLADIASALAWWAARTTENGCTVSFNISDEYRHGDSRVQQGLEPITHPSTDADLWVSNVMGNFGYTSGSHIARVAAFNAWLRSNYGTDRAYTAFVCYNPWPAPNEFTDKYAAFAYSGGPYANLLYRNYDSSFDQVFAHESGHVFWACDEYYQEDPPAGCTECVQCSDGVDNGNCEHCNPESVACMMKEATWDLCTFTPGQLGWWHCNGTHSCFAIFNSSDAPFQVTSVNSPSWLALSPQPPYNIPGWGSLRVCVNAHCGTCSGADLDGTIVIHSNDPDEPSLSVSAHTDCPTPPTADFSGSPRNGLAPLAVQFTDQSSGQIASWAWDFDNNGTTDSTAENPSRTYNSPGTYSVKLTVTGPGGSDSELKTNYITVTYPPPVADFTGTPRDGRAPLTVQFTDQSSGEVTSWAWDFDNNGTTDSTVRNPNSTYDSPGTYSVKLTVTGPGGSDPELKANYIHCVECLVAGDCNDGNFCNGDEICNGNGECGQGTPLDCDDNDECTTDTCDRVSGCINTPITCNDDSACTTDSCNPSTGCVYTPITCNDASACTTDSCNPATGCVYVPVSCDDGDPCTTDTCDPLTGCAHAAVRCNDGNACTSDTCDPATGCVYTPISCDDSDACTSDSCNPATGCVHNAITCNDGNACTADTCDPLTGCAHAAVTCNDGNACTSDSCDPSTGCVFTAITCNDGSACTIDSCDPASGCVYTPRSCDDDDECTTDTCDPASGCINTAITCDDDSECTTDTCDPDTGCVFTAISCDDGNACTADGCDPATGCTHAAVDCDDDNACTTDTCDPATGCVHTAITCNDGSVCTTDTCDPAAGCVYTPISCDDGVACTVDTCDPATGCANTPNHVYCQNGLWCDGQEVCHPTAGCQDSADPCLPPLLCDEENDRCVDCLTDEECDDSDPCTGAEYCDESGTCQNGTPLDCDDDDACTADSCEPYVGCVNTALTCNDNNACTTDTCDPLIGCVYTPIDVPTVCDDDDACTEDTCDRILGCVNTAIDCDDDDACTEDTCDPLTGCVNTAIDCDDDIACTADSCNPATGCMNAAIPCNDNIPCTIDTCNPATGCVFTPMVCNDGDPCTTDACVNGSCVYTPIVCNDDDACTTDACVNGTCVFTPITCNDQNACTADSCDPATGCRFTAITCNDQNACTTDSCDPASGCVYTPITCDDDSECTTDTCDPETGCVFTAILCDDGNACTVDGCNPATGCTHAAVDCDDDDACTTDTCDPATGCVHTAITCNDGSVCTTDTCDPAAGCVYTPISCDDGVACTVDTCDPATGCANTPNHLYCQNGLWCDGQEVCHPTNGCQDSTDPCLPPLLCDEGNDRCVDCLTDEECDDSNPCTGEEYCDDGSGTCQNGTPLDCDDDDACTADSCEPYVGCVNAAITCNDNDACTTDTCNPASGCVHTAISCDDQNACTTDSCNPATGCVNEPLESGMPCDDEAFCNGPDTCESGICLHAGDPCAPRACEEETDQCICPLGDVIFVDPPSGTVDARQPYPPSGDPECGQPRQGIESILVEAPAGSDHPDCWTLCETKVDGTPNTIADIVDNGDGTFSVNLARTISPGAVTTLTYTDGDGTASRGAFISHPANVNGDSASAPSDILCVIDYINHVAVSPWGIYSEDVDHSNMLGPPDILRVIDLLNGAGCYDPWLNVPLPQCGECCR